jgi:hypothetical protein
VSRDVINNGIKHVAKENEKISQFLSFAGDWNAHQKGLNLQKVKMKRFS